MRGHTYNLCLDLFKMHGCIANWSMVSIIYTYIIGRKVLEHGQYIGRDQYMTHLVNV